MIARLPFTFRGASATVLGLFATQGVAFVVEATVARALGAPALGLLAVGTGIATTIGGTIVAGCGGAASTLVARSHERHDRDAVAAQLRAALWIAGLAASLPAAVILLFAEPLAIVLTRDPSAVTVIRLFALTLPAQSVAGVAVSVALALGRPAAEVQYRWTDAFVRIFSIPALLALHVDVTFVAAIHLAAAVISAPLPVRVALRLAGVSAGGVRVQARSFLTLAGWQTLATAAWLAGRRGDVIAVSVLLGSTAAGVYRLAALLASVVGLSMSALQPVFFPVAARRLASQGPASLADYYRRVTRLASSAVAVTSALLLAAQGTILAFFPSSFECAGGALFILVVSQLVFAVGGHASSVAQVMGTPARATLNVVIGVMAQVLALVVLAPVFGVVGAALAALIGIAVTQSLQVRTVWRTGHITVVDASWLRSVVLTIGVVAAGAIAGRLFSISAPLAGGLLAGSLVGYAVLVFVFVLPALDRQIMLATAHSLFSSLRFPSR